MVLDTSKTIKEIRTPFQSCMKLEVEEEERRGGGGEGRGEEEDNPFKMMYLFHLIVCDMVTRP